MKLGAIIRGIEAVSVIEGQDAEVLGVVCDSRQVRPGCIFVAIPGTKRDGWSFMEDAVGRGAVAVVSEHDEKVRKGVTQVRVKDSRQALADIACIFYGRPSSHLHIIGITGTNGKTTTSYMVRDMLRADGRKPGLLGTVEYAIGERTIPAGRTTPDAASLQSMLAQMVSVGCKSAVMEVSSHSLVQKRTAGIDYDAAVFTNLTRDHLDYHVTVEKYFEAKLLLFGGLGKGSKDAVAVINVDDPWGRQLAQISDLRAEVLTYGISPDAMVRAEDIELKPDGTVFRIRTTWGTEKIRMKLLGRFNVSNALAGASL